MEVDKGDLLQLLSYMEGELQARDVTIAALRVSCCVSGAVKHNKSSSHSLIAVIGDWSSDTLNWLTNIACIMHCGSFHIVPADV